MRKVEILGKGISYPFKFEKGKVGKKEGSPKLQNSLELLFDVGEDEVFMSELTSPLRKLVFINDRNAFRALAESYIIDMIDKYEPRIEYVQAIDFDFKDHEVYITVHYKEVTETVTREFVYKYELE